MRKRLAFVLATTALAPPASAQTKPPQLYLQASAPVKDRVADLLSHMTLEEKVAQLQSQGTLPDLSGAGMPTAIGIIKKGQVDDAIARRVLSQGIGAFTFMSMGPLSAADGVKQQNAVQKWLLANTRLGIPALFQAEALHGAVVDGATSFPQAIALGSTWDPELVRKMFGVVGAEARAAGMSQVLAPVLDLARDPRFGRVEEMYSEDPYLVTTLGLAAIQGLQGNGIVVGQDHVIATAKHFVHGQPENGTNVSPSDYSEHTMREIFFPPFEAAVKTGKIGAVMPSYNENDGSVPSHASDWLLRDILRGEWGFAGMTVSDWGGVTELHTKQFIAPTNAAAGVLAINSGVDMELPTASGFTTLVEAVKAGQVSQQTLDAAVSHVLEAKFNAGLFEHPYTDVKRTPTIVGAKAHAALARQVADEAAVLLKNADGLLPLDPKKTKSLAVIGPNADKVRLGTYSNNPASYVTVLEGIRKRLGGKIAVSYAEGVRISEPDTSPMLNKLLPFKAPAPEKDAELIAQAVETAKSADAVILVLGGNEALSREAFSQGMAGPALGDTDNLELPGRQNELVRQIAKLGKPVVAVILGGRPYSIEQLSQTVPAILQGWYLGQETGNSVAGILFGDVNPSGRLPVTIARNVGQLPVFYYQKPAARMGYVGSDNSPLYPFGYGLSYTSFRYGKPLLDRASISRSGTAKLSVTVSNTGARRGDEIVQLYVHPRYTTTVQPVLRLAGYKRITLNPGETTTVRFDVGPQQLAIMDKSMKWTVEAGPVDIAIGSSARETAKVELQVTP